MRSPLGGTTEALVKAARRGSTFVPTPPLSDGSLLKALVAAGVVCGLGMAAGCGDSSPGEDGGGGTGAGSSVSMTPAPGGVRRLTSSQMRYSIEYLLGSEAAITFDVWDDPQLRGFEAIAAAELAIGANDVSTLETAVGLAVDTSLLDLSHLAGFVPCVQGAQDAACFETVATEFGRLAWRRPVEDDEKGRLVAIANEAQTWASGDFTTGLRYQLSAIFQSPNFVYQVELGTPLSEGRHVLSGYEMASRLSFFLVHRTPDVALLDAAASGELDSEEGLRQHAQRMLALPEARRSLDRFFAELYLIRDLTEISKDATVAPDWGPGLAVSMQEEMLRFLQDIVWTRDADAREIFTSTRTFVDANLASFYGVAIPAGGWALADLPADQGRFGLLGKAGFLARFAHPKMTSPTRRGRFFREKLLCREIPPPPPGVDTTLPEPTEPKTMRERLEAHAANEQCAGCHGLMDPIGLSFEHFDPVGRWRATDNGFEIDTSGKSSDIEFDNPEDLAKYASENSAQCFVRNFWRGSMGHLETEGEEPAIEELEAAFADGGFKIQDLMVELVVNPGFRQVGEPK